MNVRVWKGPLPLLTDASEDILVPMASDVECGEFVLIREFPDSKSIYLTRVKSVTDVTVTVAAWGTTSKNYANGKYMPVLILDSSKAPVLKPRRGQTTKPWRWDVPTESFDDPVVLREVAVLPTGKLEKMSKTWLKGLCIDKYFTF